MAFIPNDNEPRVGKGSISQSLFADLVKLTAGIPVLAESAETLFAVEPFSWTEKESDVSENDNAGGTSTVKVT